MISYIFTFIVGLVLYAIFSAVFPDVAQKINELQLKLVDFFKKKFGKKVDEELTDEVTDNEE